MLMLVSKCLKYMLIYAYMFLFLHFLLIFTVYSIHYIFVIYIYIYMKNICFPMRIQRIENPAAAVPAQRTQGSPSAATGWEACGDRMRSPFVATAMETVGHGGAWLSSMLSASHNITIPQSSLSGWWLTYPSEKL